MPAGRHYFRAAILSIAIAWGKRNVSNLCRQLDQRGFRPRERFNNFFLKGRWSPVNELQKKAYELLEKSGLRKGDVIEIFIDDTKKNKRGKKMAAISKFFDPTTLSVRNLFFRKKKQRCSFLRGERESTFTYVDADWLDVKGIGRLHLVLSRKRNKPGILGIVTDDPSLSASEIIEVYGQRWHIEVFFKDAKQLLGLGQYQNGTCHSAVTHLHLVCFAYALLTHVAIERDRAQGKRKKHPCLSACLPGQQENFKTSFAAWPGKTSPIT
ncbi:MAG TPA: hypothetical protein EYP19_15785 [Desulfobacterales bacterium]|nr:hypothetical protein [Desulfobacterales bacterium]